MKWIAYWILNWTKANPIINNIKKRNIMKTRVRTTSKFIVKPENKVVVCNLTVRANLLETPLFLYTNWDSWKTKAPMVNRHGMFTVTAKARCNSEDTFDETVGKRIAESRAKAKAFKIAKNMWNCIAKDLAEKADIASTLAKNCAVVEEIEVKHVEKLVE